MPNYIKVTSPTQNLSWEKQLSNQEFDLVKSYCKGKRTFWIIEAALTPVRTDSWGNFSKDLFFPTLEHHATKVQDATYRIFAMITAIFFDLVTFPIRLINCIPRVIKNSKKEDHPLYQYLQSNKVDLKFLEPDHLLVTLGWEGKSSIIAKWRNPDGTVSQTSPRSQMWSTQPVNFIDLPKYEGADYFSSGSSTIPRASD